MSRDTIDSLWTGSTFYLSRSSTIRKPFLLGVALISALLLSSCQYVPGTKENAEKWATDEIANRMPDGPSTEFRHVKVDNIKPYTVCGEVNGKNEIGNIIGWRRFVGLTSVNAAMIENNYETLRNAAISESDLTAIDDNQSLFEESWKFCTLAKRFREQSGMLK